MRYSPAEATAWIVIALKDMGWDVGNDEHIRRAVSYLHRCVDLQGGAATTPRDIANPRTLPTALILWALSLQEGDDDIRGKMITRLRTVQDESGGWGIAVGAAPNAATTAQVLHALRVAQCPQEVKWLKDGTEYLVDRQQPDGSWKNSYDEWFTAELEGDPSRCVHYGTGWALLALADFPDDPGCRKAAERAVRYLLGCQRPSGAWLFEEHDPVEQVWCTTQVMVALTSWQKTRPVHYETGGKGGAVRGVGRSAAGLVRWARESFLYLAFGALCVSQTWGFIQPQLAKVLATFKLDAAGIWTNLASSAIWAALALLVAWLGKRIHSGDENRS
ncbi:hypothetical protein GCM10010517_14070 [Streptosporangium fragile]|uniref:Squalene cyclase C-terminal domain-containing protein n=1 Tax=Streptosporangium fragile TaxID=46186 RepID=A0ABP6I8L9_9ACTN